ncbi:unnamed protein product [Pneumocystis jirovecii]|uniref:SUZ domain-containing protein n=2 Tax=Pneumocystis jirovecii TaxID=42068 RepID=L0PDG7_PNEJI|nr:uncharacterized protein T551_03321 [Pneumocystis jirovecii RU7]KTW26859.1 hypothetical protein T551_03321 [Pneumocystis jirovecii RU7]CCJ30373.1 unnamed protein product [Pneumocystis jirovecii]
MNDEKYKEKVPDFWDHWENERNFDGKSDEVPSTKKVTHQDNMRLWEEANQRAPDVEVVNSSRTAYKPSLKILRRSAGQSSDSSVSNALPEKFASTEPEQGHREKEQRYKEVRQKIFGTPTLENKPCIPIRSPIGPCSEGGFSGGKN